MKIISTVLTFIAATVDGPDLTDITEKFNQLVGSIWGVCMSVGVGAALIYGGVIGGMYIKSLGDEQKKKSASSALKTFFIGIAIIFFIAATIGGIMTALAKWANVSFGAY